MMPIWGGAAPAKHLYRAIKSLKARVAVTREDDIERHIYSPRRETAKDASEAL